MLPITVNTPKEQKDCPIRNVLAQVSGKWQILILLALEDGALRFAEVKRAIGDVSQRVLTENLRGLERDGYLTRTVISSSPIKVSYELTQRGQAFVEGLKPLIDWACLSFDDIQKSALNIWIHQSRVNTWISGGINQTIE